MQQQTDINPATGFKPLTPSELAIKRALSVLASRPTPEEMNDEGFCMAHFLSEIACAVRDILEGTE
jgi:hypothetical protein